MRWRAGNATLADVVWKRAKPRICKSTVLAWCDAPGVGQNLQDHPNVPLFYRSKKALDFAYPQVYAFDTADGHSGAPEMCWVLYAAPASMQQAMKRMLPIMALPRYLRLHERS